MGWAIKDLMKTANIFSYRRNLIKLARSAVGKEMVNIDDHQLIS